MAYSNRVTGVTDCFVIFANFDASAGGVGHLGSAAYY